MGKLNTRRDSGLMLAIAGAGSVSALARRLGLSQPSISRWKRVPAERVVEVEAASGIAREFLRPDLYRGTGADGVEPLRELNGRLSFDRPDA